MPAPWAMPLCFTLLQTQKTHQVRSVVGRKDIEGNVPSWLTCSSPLGGGLGRAVAFLSLILGSLHPPPRPWGRGNLFSRVVWARPGQEGMEGGGQVLRGPIAEGPHLCQRVERGPSTHLISVGFGLSLGERTHTLLAGRALVVSEVGS